MLILPQQPPMDTEGIYLKCLKYGYEHGPGGVSYNHMYKMLSDLGFRPNHSTFYIWFFDNFEFEQITLARYFEAPDKTRPEWKYDATQTNHLDHPFPLTLDALQKYYDAVNATESLAEAKRSTYLAKIAIISSIALGLIGAIIGAIQIGQNCNEVSTLPVQCTQQCCKQKLQLVSPTTIKYPCETNNLILSKHDTLKQKQ